MGGNGMWILVNPGLAAYVGLRDVGFCNWAETIWPIELKGPSSQNFIHPREPRSANIVGCME